MPPPAHDAAGPRSAAFRPAKGIVSCILGGDFVLFSESHQCVYRFDAPSASAWLGMSAGEPSASIARRIADETECSMEKAGECISSWLAEWQRFGFLSESREEPVEPALKSNDEPACVSASGYLYRVAETNIAISFPDDRSKHAWDAMAGHLRREVSGVAEIKLAVEPHEGGYHMSGHSTEGSDFTTPAAVAVNLKEAALHALLRRRTDWIALHSAVLSVGSRSMLLAGSAGRGKTTLAAVLNASGLPAIADDVALISARPPAIRGLPFAFAAKPGSWSVLRPWFPDLDELPEFRRPDGRVVKYIRPISMAEQASSLAAVVFPQFSAATPLRIREMTKVAGLLALLEEAINANRRLTAEGFLGLSGLVEHATVIGMEYGDVNAAAGWIKANLAGLAGVERAAPRL